MRDIAAEDYNNHWEEIFRSRAWGRYPPEDLVRFMGRNFKHHPNKGEVHILELGCGAGANIWFLHREGFKVAGIDISPTAIKLAGERLDMENKGLNDTAADLKAGNFSKLPWQDGSFDMALDVGALCANTPEVIAQTLTETARVLKPGGFLYVKCFGTNTTGYGTGQKIGHHTFKDVASGPFLNMGTVHFFDREDIDRMFGQLFTPIAIDVISRSDTVANQHFEEFWCQFKKAG